MTDAPAHTWSALQPGQPLGPVTHEIKAATHRDYCTATGETDSLFLAPDGSDAALIVPPAISNLFSTHVLGLPGINRPSGDIHAGHEYEFIRPVRVGDVITTHGYLIEKYRKRGRRYLIFDTLSLNAEGALVIRCRVTFVVPE